MSVLVVLTWSLGAAELSIGLLTSPNTPAEVSEVLREASQATDLSTAELVLDYSYNTALSVQLLESGRFLVCMYEGCPSDEVQSAGLPEEFALEFGRHLRAINFANAFLVGDSQRSNLELLSHLDDTLAFSNKATLSEEATREQVLQFVGRVLKPAGTNLGVFLVSPHIAVSLLSALREYHLLGQGFAYVLTQKAMWGLYEEMPRWIDGLMYVSDSATVNATSRVEYERVVLGQQLEAIAEAVQRVGDSAAAVRSYLLTVYSGKSRNCTTAIVNVRHARPSVERPFLFPGNSTLLPKYSQALIYVSGDYSGISADGSFYPNMESIARGFIIAYQEVNQRADILPNFLVVNNSVSLGLNFDFQWALLQIAIHKDAIGVVHHAVGLSENVIGLTAAFQLSNLSTPIVTSAGSSRLSDVKKFPLFVRPTSDMLFLANVMARFFKLFGWRRAAFIYSPLEDDINYYSSFLAVSSQFGLEITNNETNRMVLPDLSAVQEQLNRTVSEILESSVRIVIISHLFSYYIVERMYDLGARAGDYLFVMSYGLSTTFYMGSEESVRKRRVVTKGAVMFFMDLFVGEVGQSVLRKFKQADRERYYEYGCIFYDCAMLAAHALDFMVTRGQHYEDGYAFAEGMRETRFQGCAGHIQIESGTNDKLPGGYVIINMHVDDKFENVTLMNVAKYSPFGVQLFNISQDLQWPNGESTFPDTWELDPHCPYYAKDIKTFPKGQVAIGVVGAGFLMISLASSAYAWRKWRRVDYALLNTPQEITTEDVLTMASVPIDFLQIAALGLPAGLNVPLTNILNLFTLDLEPIINMSQGAFWAIEIAIFGLVAVFLIVGVVKYLDTGSVLASVCVVGSMCYWADLALPFVSNALFLPAVHTLLSTFVCLESTGPNFTDSFLVRDCHQRCWVGPHVLYSVFAAAVLLVYTPAAIVTQPQWQSPQTRLKALPSHSVIKSVTQVLLAVTCAIMRGSQDAAYGYVYLSIVSAYLPLTLRFPAFNYSR